MNLTSVSYLGGIAILSLIPLSDSAAQTAFESANFHINSQMVLVPVGVTDHAGRTLNGLRRDVFTVFDEQQAQEILSFSSEDAPCSVGLVLDTSGSMRYALRVA